MRKSYCVVMLFFMLFLMNSFAGDDGGEFRNVFSQIRMDEVFDDLVPYVIDGWDMKHEFNEKNKYSQIVPLGATIKVIIRNDFPSEKNITAICMDDIDIMKHLIPVHNERGGIKGTSYNLNKPEITPDDVKKKLDSFGEPIWYRISANPVPAGGFSEITIRLRSKPYQKAIGISIKSDNYSSEKSVINSESPVKFRVASVNFNKDISRVYIYLRNYQNEEFTLKSLTIDRREIDISGLKYKRSFKGFLPVEIPLDEKWEFGSQHYIGAETIEGEHAGAVVKAHDDFFALGMWGYRNNGDDQASRAKDTGTAIKNHLFNTIMHMGAENGQWMESPEGMKWVEENNLRFMVRDPAHQNIRNPVSYARFLFDEPDANDYGFEEIKPDKRVGTLGQGIIVRKEAWTKNDKRTPTLLNLDETYKPENWWTYGQFADITSIDPYYQPHIQNAFAKHPGWLGRFGHPFFVYAAADIARHAVEPQPLHIILNSISYTKDNEYFRYGTPEEKRIEFYYALAAGTKGISYWWFTPYGEFMGCGADHPDAKAMMAEMKILNAEARAVSDMLAAAHPAEYGGKLYDPLYTAAPAWVFGRTLFSGTDTVMIIIVNRDHFSDEKQTRYAEIPNVRNTFRLPENFEPKNVIRMNSLNPESLKFDIEQKDNDKTAKFEFKNLRLTEMIIITEDIKLKDELTSRCAELKKSFEK